LGEIVDVMLVVFYCHI